MRTMPMEYDIFPIEWALPLPHDASFCKTNSVSCSVKAAVPNHLSNAVSDILTSIVATPPVVKL